jgi:crotonobetainyl-CoA:carnitine CoA-transferase CaiB-like acyl-CoA transferase
MGKVLGGLRVIEQGAFITGPAAAMLLGDLGADVVKVEHPENGDPYRAFKGGLYSPHYQAYNRNKRSVTLDTKKASDLALFDELIRDADIYIQNFRPGTADRLNAGYERLLGINPRLIYCAITGFGPTGPSAGRPAYDSVAQAMSGLLGQFVNPANPRVVGPAIADALTGFYASYGILGALHERNRTGRGCKVEVSMLEAVSHFNLDAFTQFYAAGEVAGPYSRPRVSQSYVMECSDGKWLALHLSSPEKFWRGLIEAIEKPELLLDSRFVDRTARIANQDELIKELAAAFILRPRGAWCERLEAHDVPYAPMYDVSEAMEDPQAMHMELVVETTHPVMGASRTIRPPWSFDGGHNTAIDAPPMLGEHNEELLEPLRAWRGGTTDSAHKRAGG